MFLFVVVFPFLLFFKRKYCLVADLIANIPLMKCTKTWRRLTLIGLIALSFSLFSCTSERHYSVNNANLSQVTTVFDQFIPLFGYELGYYDRGDDHTYARIEIGPQVKVIPGETRYESSGITTIDNDEILNRDEIRKERTVKSTDRPAQQVVSNWRITLQMVQAVDGVSISAKANDEFDPGYFLEDYFKMLEDRGYKVILK